MPYQYIKKGPIMTNELTYTLNDNRKDLPIMKVTSLHNEQYTVDTE